MNKSRNRVYSNGEITIYWRAGECVHATLCYSELRSVFDPMRRPWVNAQGASTEKIKDIIERCPSEALTFRWNDDQRNLTETSKKLFKGNAETLFPKPEREPLTRITIRRNGPMVISGEFRMMDANGKELKQMRMVSLCRCGASGSMPYCDGTHFKLGFKG